MELKARFDRVGGLSPVKGDVFVPVPEPEIVGVETEIGAKLPPLYREFLATFGASIFCELVEFSPVQPLPPSISSTGRGLVNVLYGAGVHTPHDLGGTLQMYRSRMPEGFLPIAGDGGGDQIAMAAGGDGAIYYWDHHSEWDAEDYEDDGLPVPPDLKWQNVTAIARSFEAFLDTLSVRKQPGG
jgi:hypothetical protein